MIDASKLSAPWRTVREVTTAGVLEIPAGVHAAVRSAWSQEFCYIAVGPVTLDEIFDAYLPLTKHGSANEAERTSTVTREWTEAPPNDETWIVVLWSHHTVKPGKGADTQTPWTNNADEEDIGEIAWMFRSEWDTFLRGPRVVHALVTAEDYVSAIMARDTDIQPFSYEKRTAHINARLAARTTAPVVTGKMMWDSMCSDGREHNAWDYETETIRARWERAAAHLTAALASGMVP